MAANKLVVIDEQLLSSMAQSPTFIAVFPFLQSVSKVTSGCGRCRRKASVQTVDFGKIKLSVAEMGGPSKAKLKQMLNAERVRLVFRNRRNQTIKMTF